MIVMSIFHVLTHWDLDHVYYSHWVGASSLYSKHSGNIVVTFQLVTWKSPFMTYIVLGVNSGSFKVGPVFFIYSPPLELLNRVLELKKCVCDYMEV